MEMNITPVFQHILSHQQTRQHEGATKRRYVCCHHPSDDSLSLFGVYVQLLRQFVCLEVKFITIGKSVVACIIWRVDIDALHLPGIRIGEMLECIKVITADIDVLAIDILWFWLCSSSGTMTVVDSMFASMRA